MILHKETAHNLDKNSTIRSLINRPFIPDTILQPCIKPSKVVHIPSPKDIKNANKYLLTHQKEDKDGEIETQLIKVKLDHLTQILIFLQCHSRHNNINNNVLSG